MVALLEKGTEKSVIPDFVPQGKTEFERSYAYVGYLLETAFTVPEVDAALSALAAHQARFNLQSSEIAHGFHNTVDAAKERAHEAEKLGLTPEQIDERNNLLKSVLWCGFPDDPYNSALLNDVREHLELWLHRFPNDPSVARALERVKGDLEVAAMLNLAE